MSNCLVVCSKAADHNNKSRIVSKITKGKLLTLKIAKRLTSARSLRMRTKLRKRDRLKMSLLDLSLDHLTKTWPLKTQRSKKLILIKAPPTAETAVMADALTSALKIVQTMRRSLMQRSPRELIHKETRSTYPINAQAKALR
jgi:transcriptional regulator of met regulon